MRFLLPRARLLGATLGIGFLAQFEGLFINTPLPVFAGIAGPLMVLATLYLFFDESQEHVPVLLCTGTDADSINLGCRVTACQNVRDTRPGSHPVTNNRVIRP
jgi:hypothetical protein